IRLREANQTYFLTVVLIVLTCALVAGLVPIVVPDEEFKNWGWSFRLGVVAGVFVISLVFIRLSRLFFPLHDTVGGVWLLTTLHNSVARVATLWRRMSNRLDTINRIK